MTGVTTLEELLPLVRDVPSCKAFGRTVAENVPREMKQRLAREARDALGRTWRDTTLCHAVSAAGGRRPSGGGALPPPSRDQARADRLVAAAVADHPVDPLATQRLNLVRLLTCCARHGGRGMNLPSGYVGAVMSAFDAAGSPRPTPSIVRWFRSHLQDDPLCFRGTAGMSAELVAVLEGWPTAEASV